MEAERLDYGEPEWRHNPFTSVVQKQGSSSGKWRRVTQAWLFRAIPVCFLHESEIPAQLGLLPSRFQCEVVSKRREKTFKNHTLCSSLIRSDLRH